MTRAHSDIIRRIAFSQIKGINLSTARELVERVGSIDDFFELSQGELWQKIGASKAYCTDSERAKLLSVAEDEYKFIEKSGIEPIYCDDDNFSSRLSMCDDAPALVYKLGPCNLNSHHIVGIVGTRNATMYGIDFTRRLVEDLRNSLEDLVIVSGLAYGIDVAAHRAALSSNVPTIAVVAHGLKTIYPADHRDIASRMVHNGGAILTEYISSAPIHRGNFLARNRIVAGLCDAIIVVESDTKGGALVTARLALDYNREVCALPGRCTDRYSRGCNALIAEQKASLIRDANDLIDLMNWITKPQEGSQTAFDFDELSPEMKVIIEYIRTNPQASVGELASVLNIPFPTLSARIMEMELDDMLTSLPGGTFQLNI